MPCRVENIVRRGEIACCKQFLLFSQCCLHLHISLVCQNSVLCGVGKSIYFIGNKWLNSTERQCLGLLKLKAFADDRINVIQKLELIWEWEG